MKFNDMIFNVKIENKQAIIDIDGEIGEYADWNAFEINAENTNKGFKQKLNEIKDVNEIIVNINSLGGSVFHGISIHDQLKSRKEKIIVNILGYTASIATIIAMAGDTINMSKNAMILIHRASIGVQGNIDDMISAVEDLNTIDNSLVDIYHKRTKIPKSNIMNLMKEGNGDGKWISAKTAKKLGYVDNIYEPGKEIKNNCFDGVCNSVKNPEIDDDELLNLLKEKLEK